MTRTLISIDLDWLNGQENPIDKLTELLQYIPKDIPTVMTVEHHEFLPHLRRWIKAGKVLTPFNVLQIDEHHDYYINYPPHDPNGTEVNCGNWGYRLPLEWYNRYTWVHNPNGEFCDWKDAQLWLNERSIKCSFRDKHRLSQLRTDIVAAIFCVSPDYLQFDMYDYIVDAVEVVARHFKMAKAPLRVKGTDVLKLNGWRIAPRPMKIK